MNQIAYKFVSWDVPALESLAGSKAYILRKRLNDGHYTEYKGVDKTSIRSMLYGRVERIVEL